MVKRSSEIETYTCVCIYIHGIKQIIKGYCEEFSLATLQWAYSISLTWTKHRPHLRAHSKSEQWKTSAGN